MLGREEGATPQTPAPSQYSSRSKGPRFAAGSHPRAGLLEVRLIRSAAAAVQRTSKRVSASSDGGSAERRSRSALFQGCSPAFPARGWSYARMTVTSTWRARRRRPDLLCDDAPPVREWPARRPRSSRLDDAAPGSRLWSRSRGCAVHFDERDRRVSSRSTESPPSRGDRPTCSPPTPTVGASSGCVERAVGQGSNVTASSRLFPTPPRRS